jgi:hypothetical protein
LGVGGDDVTTKLSSDFLEVLQRLADASERLSRQTGACAVLVGGAAVELYTGGAYRTGDFDVYVSDVSEFQGALKAAGFVQEDQPRYLKNFWYLPRVSRYGVQLVSGQLFDGRCERLRLLMVTTESGTPLALPPVEDLIADRLGQHAVSSPTDDSMLQQARLLLLLAEKIDWDYLSRRVRDEGGDISLLSSD